MIDIDAAFDAEHCHRSLGWRWIEWIVAILAFSTAIGLVALLPETQYTRKSGQPISERRWMDNYRFWPVSGGGAPKVHRQVALSD